MADSDDDFVFPTRSLFKRVPPNEPGASLGDVILNSTYYAVTVNIAPNKHVNKKRWHTYTHDKQRSVLERLEASFRRKTPSVVLHKIVFENCPVVKNVHFHALYEMPPLYESTLRNHWVVFDDNNNSNDAKSDWRHLDIRPVHNVKGWLEYISKTLK